ncbi:PAS domain-containing protein [Methylobacterium soli]|nr:PAS domain-containing protein [Methylobacterium soli]GJE41524.1 hypothetical protein AEGHOMDF_0690 [Methylobacterium soli]
MNLEPSVWPRGDGEMAERIREHDWAATLLGPIGRWPQSLRTAVDMVLAMPGPANILWGPAHVQLYNDAYIAIAKDRHPELLGRPAAEGWPEVHAEVLVPVMKRAFAGRATRIADLSVTLLGHDGRSVQRAFDTTWSPIRDDHGAFAGAMELLVEVADRRREETNLRESEAQHRLLIEDWVQAVWETDGSGVVVADSPSWRAYTGQTLGEWLGYGWLDAIHPDDRSYAERQWREAISAHGLINTEFRLRAPDGGWRWTNVRAAPVLNAGAHVEKWVGINIDIDIRKRSEERYRTLFDAMDEAYAVVEVIRDESHAWSDFRFLEVNPAFMQHTSMPYPVGKTATELLGTPNPRWTQMYGQVLDTGEPLRVQEAEQTLGRIFDLNIFSLDRERNRVAVLFTDITGRVCAEAALRESEERFRALVTAGGNTIYRMSPDWRRMYQLDSATLAATAEPIEDWVEKYILAEDLPRVRAAIDVAIDTKSLFELEHRVLLADGSVGWVLSRAVPLLGPNSEIVEWFGAGSDVTTRREMQERQGVLVAELQHRTRNLLGVVRSIAQQTMAQTGPTEHFREQFNDRLSALSRVQDLLSRSDQEPITLRALIQTELDALGAGAMQDRIRLHGPFVRLRKATVQTFALALHELATNARKYGALTSEHGQLRVTWRTYAADGEGRRLLLDWVEEGISHPLEGRDAVSKRRGYGRELIERALPYVLQAETSYELGETVLRCSIDLPLSERADPRTRA